MIRPLRNYLALLTIHSHYAWTVPAPSKVSRQNTIHPQHQSLCHEQSSRKARGQITIHEQWQLMFIKQCPDIIIQNTICFWWKRNSPSVKAIHSPWFQQSPEESKASSSLYKEPLVSFFSRSSFSNTSQSLFSTTLNIVSGWQSQFTFVTWWPQSAFLIIRWPQLALYFV